MQTGGITNILRQASDGNHHAREEVARLVIDQLRDIATRLMRHENPGHTLQPTLLADEALMRLLGRNGRESGGRSGGGSGGGISFTSRAHFYAIAATEIRRILVNHAEKKSASKRGDGKKPVTLVDVGLSGVSGVSARRDASALDVLALNETLSRLETFEPTGARIVEMRFFGGMTMQDIATAIDKPLRTVEREWQTARAWLRKELGSGGVEE